ncbi:MAG: AMP-binding protein, partial [bacterium]|nr:AMP-binding protein [bacterium]
TFTCCFPFPDDPDIIDTVPIGYPISNTEVYILDRHYNPVPVGIPGELHIGGAGLARSYLNRPDFTKEKFIENPFSDKPGSRLYKTGDLCRYLPDGNIEFLGRIDHQVKVRGFRIELGEIESVLSRHGQVKEAVVIAREDQPGNKQLAAYLVPKKEDKAPEHSDLREFLKAKLPDYMIPAAYVILESLPLTPNGKIDRKALPSPDPDLMRAHEFVGPRNETEEIIAE